MSQNGKGFCMRYLILLALAAVLLFSGCIQQPATPAPTTPEITCPTNYMKIGNACCLDANGNGICDRDEAPPVQQNATVCPPVSCPACAVANVSTSANLTLADRVNQCNQIFHAADQTTCLEMLAEETNTQSICDSFISGRTFDSCYENLAIKYKNLGYCDQLVGYEMADCKTKVNDALGK